jgi:hypothetical protein
VANPLAGNRKTMSGEAHKSYAKPPADGDEEDDEDLDEGGQDQPNEPQRNSMSSCSMM